MQKGVVRKRNPSPLSEYGRQLKEKQTLKREYNLKEYQLKNYVKKVLERRISGANSPEIFVRQLELRLDNVVFRAGFAATRSQARQMVSHGHFLVNGKPMNIPSYQAKSGDVISVRPLSANAMLFKNVSLALKKFQAPSWIELQREALSAKIAALPTVKDAVLSVEIPVIFDFYSR